MKNSFIFLLSGPNYIYMKVFDQYSLRDPLPWCHVPQLKGHTDLKEKEQKNSLPPGQTFRKITQN